MKIILNQDPSFPETEVTINEDILRLVAMLRIHQKKLVGTLEGEQHLLDVRDILYIDTVDKRTFLYTGKAVYESALRLYELEEGLRNLDFFRIGRSTIVNFYRIRSIRPELGGRLLVTVDNGERLYVSRQYAAGIKEKLREVERGILS